MYNIIFEALRSLNKVNHGEKKILKYFIWRMETEAQEREEVGVTEIVRRWIFFGTFPKKKNFNPMILVCRIYGAYFFIVVLLLNRKQGNDLYIYFKITLERWQSRSNIINMLEHSMSSDPMNLFKHKANVVQNWVHSSKGCAFYYEKLEYVHISDGRRNRDNPG